MLVLTVASFGYGFHRDELYFLAAGDHLAWGYPDQPPVTPLLAWLAESISPGSVWAVRIPATLASAATVLLVALIAREMGASRRGQFLAAVAMAASGYVLVTGHLLLTNTPELCLAALAGWLVARLLRTGDRWLLGPLGVVTGVGLLTKSLFALLVFALLVGVLVAGPRRVLRSWWLLAGVGIAALLWLPNLLWQAGHGWPQIEMMGVLAAEGNLGGRLGFVPFQFLLFGPVLSVVWLAGLVRLLRAPEFRAFGVAYLVMAVLLLVGGGTAYYLADGYPALVAAGAIGVDRWLTSRGRGVLVGVAVTGSAVMNALLGLPIVPAEQLRDTPIVAIYHEAGEQVGWPRLVEQVAAAHRALPEAERARAVVVTTNYGQAGAIRVFGPAHGLPAVFSGHNGWANWAAPPDAAEVVLVVGGRQPPPWTRVCRSLVAAGTVDNGAGLDNDEQGTPIRVCRGMSRPWSQVWPELRRLS
ncbi:glycosyltransferase family 39 protein [Crossiella cryophila]